MIQREESRGRWDIITGNHAVAHAARLARVKVVPAYPITPQTTIVEYIADFIARGEMDAEYIRVESEHSAMAAAIGAAAVGARTFTATASQGLLLMHEVLHWAVGARLPIGMAIVNRAVGPPWSIHVDHQDAISQRDTGWMITFVSSNQEALDSVLMMYKVAEDDRVLLPFMVCLDGFVLSHTFQPVHIPDQEDVDAFLPEYKPKHWVMDPDNPVTLGNLVMPDQDYMEMRWSIHEAMIKAKSVIKEVSAEFKDRFGRFHGDLVWEYRTDDADVIVVATGTLASETEEAVDVLRDKGESVGLLKIRSYRPFPIEDVVRIADGRKLLVVVDRSISFGQGGPLATDVRSALFTAGVDTPVVGFVTGLGGRDITYEDIAKMVAIAREKVRAREVRPVEWYKLKG
ncbi:MAG TPA: pyruvate ferredoxin oxidoreductase [Candidatus Korarchaeota archaeon]|nr:pyruvate ferredoxin oxidoreductase [Candidatus Korarchaeota archaeon]